jgi:hypothetical protein
MRFLKILWHGTARQFANTQSTRFDSVPYNSIASPFHKRPESLAALLLIAATIFHGCKHKVAEPEASVLIPQITGVDIQVNPHNVLSAIMNVHTHNAATVVVEYGAEGLLQYRTPVFSLDHAVQIPVLGLPAKTKVFMRAVPPRQAAIKPAARP